ncbi:MAG: V-type ATP synthase subunit A [Chlamydiota bacterium]
MEYASGIVTKGLGNLLYVEFTGSIRLGEIGAVLLGELALMAEVIEVAGNLAKMQVFEDTKEIAYGTPVRFQGHLLEAELGPGLLGTVFDGLQNPLRKLAKQSGLFLERGIYQPSLDREKLWHFNPTEAPLEKVSKGDLLGVVEEGRFSHQIMVPFSLHGTFSLQFLAKEGDYTIEETIAILKSEEEKEFPITMLQKWPVKSPLQVGKKVRAQEMMQTGLRIIDTQFPIVKGGTFCSPGPFGAGKTVLQHHLSKYSSVDVVVIVACGERAGEVVEVLETFPELIDQKTNRPLMDRTVMICNTSSMPVAAREASVYMGSSIAEYYRQMGLDVLLLADSTSRWAQAMREMSGRLEEIPGEEAFPAYLGSRIAAFYERAGVLRMGQKTGSLTIGGTVSPAGGNFEEPVTQTTLTLAGAFYALSRARADARQYPAIDPLISWTKYVGQVGEAMETHLPDWTHFVSQAKELLRKGDEIGKRMEVVGEEGVSIQDITLYLKAELYDIGYLQQNAFDKEDAYCPLERQVALFQLIQSILAQEFAFSSNDEAREFFLSLQNRIKNMNYLPYRSDAYETAYRSIEEQLKECQGACI